MRLVKRYNRLIIALSVLMLFFCFGLSAQKKPVISVSSRVHDFGMMLKDTANVSYTFHLRNTGSEKLCFLEFVSDCHCLTADYPKSPVLPGKDFDIVLHFQGNTQAPGHFKKGVYWSTNADPANFSLILSGTIITSDQAADLKKQSENKNMPSSKTSSSSEKSVSSSSNSLLKWIRGLSK